MLIQVQYRVLTCVRGSFFIVAVNGAARLTEPMQAERPTGAERLQNSSKLSPQSADTYVKITGKCLLRFSR